MRVIIYIILLIIMSGSAFPQTRFKLLCKVDLLNLSHQLVLSQIGIKEKTGRNDGEVEKYGNAAGFKQRIPYCYAFQYWGFKVACDELQIDYGYIPIPKSGMANAAFNYAKKNGIKTTYKAKINDLITWRKSNSGSGHIARIDSVGRVGWVWTIEGNTSNGKTGSQREGNGVFYRKRNIKHPLGRMYIRGLVGFYQERKYDKILCNLN